MKGLNEMIGRLARVRRDVTDSQITKLIRRWPEHGDYRKLSLGEAVDACRDELKELDEALRMKGPDSIRDEILDVRNTTEFLWDKLGLKALRE